MAPIMDFIIGPPGTGKTERARDYVERVASAGGGNRMALVSFTNAAANALATRVAGLIPRSNVGTLHSFAFRVLGYNSDHIAELKIAEWNKENPNYLLSANQAQANHPENDGGGDGLVEQEIADELYNVMNILRARMVNPDLYAPRVKVFSDKWNAWKAENDLIDFTDMIEIAWRDIDTMPGNPSIIVADEAQDFSLLEIALLIKWASKVERITWIGDPDQILYEFKGVAPDAFSKLIAAADRTQVLEQSYRVPQAAHKVALDWINRIIPEREKFAYHPTSNPGQIIRDRAASFIKPDSVIQAVETAVGAGQTAMIMATCSYMLEPTIRALREAGLPFWNPNRVTRGDWNPLNAGRGTSAADRILAYLRPDSTVWGEDARFWLASDLQKWVDVVQSDGVLIRGAKKAIDDLEPERVLQLDEFDKWFNPDILDKLIMLDTNWYKSVILPKKLKSFLFPFAVIEKRGAPELLKPRKIKIGTIHSFKGDEADFVAIYPDLSLRGMGEFQNPQTRARTGRQFYVGLTRAKDTIMICGQGTELAVKL